MCGRYALTSSADELAQAFSVDARAHQQPRYNIGPGQTVPVIVGEQLRQARWGFAAQTLLINARAETASVKPSFRAAFRRGRCLFPASAFYEWQHDGLHKGQPYAVRRADDLLFAMAGLWRADKESGECVILTVAANAVLSAIHPRMPAIMPQAHWRAWLEQPAEIAQGLLKPAPAPLMEAYPISRAVNKIANDAPALLERAEIEAPPQMSLL